MALTKHQLALLLVLIDLVVLLSQVLKFRMPRRQFQPSDRPQHHLWRSLVDPHMLL
jgi:hypothetical protein